MTKVKEFFEDFAYQAASWGKESRVIANIEWHPGELFPRVGFIVTNMPMELDRGGVRFYNQRGTAEQHIKEFALNNSYPVDFTLKDGGFPRLGLQGFV